MKKHLLLFMLIIGLFVGGCSKKIEQPVIFEKYKISLNTKFKYKELVANNILSSLAIKQYIQETQTGFASSIIIAKNETQTGINLTILATNNSKSMTRKIEGAKKPSTKHFTFKCGSEVIDAVIQTVTIIQGKEKQYLNQMFFYSGKNLYGVSTMTDNKQENRYLEKSIKTIICNTNI